MVDREPWTRTLTRPGGGLVLERRPLRIRCPLLAIDTERSDDSFTVGAAPGNDIVLDHATVSRIHARFEVRDRGIYLRDLDSRNGVFVEGIETVGAWLPETATVRCGAVELLVTPVARVEAFELPSRISFEGLVGRSAAMRMVFKVLARAARSDATVLLSGESGTGKELVAEAIHKASPRAAGPFIAVDCGAIPASLAESELFGHLRGSFTGAVADRAGVLELADGGTLFLDEIGELPRELQPKLLRFLESHTVRRVGAGTHRPINVRIVAATNRDLEAMVATGDFREDLYFRLAVVRVTLPPLRERPEDIELLARRFLDELRVTTTPDTDFAITPEVVAVLHARRWRGNVRELRNAIEQAAILSRLPEASDLEPPTDASDRGHAAAAREPTTGSTLELPYPEAREACLAGFERDYVSAALERFEWNVARTSRQCRITRAHLYRLMTRYDIRR